MTDTVIQQMMSQIAMWWQSVALTFVDAIALFLPPLYQWTPNPDEPNAADSATLTLHGIGVKTPDPLFQSYFSLNPSSKIGHVLAFSVATVQLLIVLKITIDAVRLYMARDAGEQILSPTVFLRRAAITVIFALSCGTMVDIFGGLTGGAITIIRETLYADFHGTGDTPEKFSYPNVRQWVRNMGCWLTLPNNQDGGLLRMPAENRPLDGVPCMGAVAGDAEVTLHWLPPDPWQTYGYADEIEKYNDQRDYWIYRSTVSKKQPDSSDKIDTVATITQFTDHGLKIEPDHKLANRQWYYYWIGTWCYQCTNGGGKEIITGPLPVWPDDRLLKNSSMPPGRALLNVLFAVSLGAGAIVIVLQTAFRTVELVFAKMVGPFMALSAMNSDEPWSHGAMSLWLREVAVLVLSQITQLMVLCLLVSTVSTTPPFSTGLGTFTRPSNNTLRFGDVVLALVLITIGTQGPRILRNFAWSGDAGKSSGLGSQYISRIATKLPW